MVNRYDYVVTNNETNNVEVFNTMKKVGKAVGMPAYALNDPTQWELYNQLGFTGRITGFWKKNYNQFTIERIKQGSYVETKQNDKSESFKDTITRLLRDGDLSIEGFQELNSRWK